MTNINDTDLKRIVDEVVSGIMREMPSQMTPDPIGNPAPVTTGAKAVAIGADHGGFPMKENLKTFLEPTTTLRYRVV